MLLQKINQNLLMNCRIQACCGIIEYKKIYFDSFFFLLAYNYCQTVTIFQCQTLNFLSSAKPAPSINRLNVKPVTILYHYDCIICCTACLLRLSKLKIKSVWADVLKEIGVADHKISGFCFPLKWIQNHFIHH